MTYLTLTSNCCAHLESRSKRSNERQKRPTAPVAYVLFDLLWDNGHDLTGKSVIQRRERLEQIITPIPGIQVGGYIENRGIELFELAREKGVEGIIGQFLFGQARSAT
jgi:ATP-dependent DNA ligase